mgnify:CR=1 FL=1
MNEKRLKQIKNSLIEDLDSIDYYGSKTAEEGLELYNEVIRLREENEKYQRHIKENLRLFSENYKSKSRIARAIAYIEPKVINEFIHTDYIYTMIDILRGEDK